MFSILQLCKFGRYQRINNQLTLVSKRPYEICRINRPRNKQHEVSTWNANNRVYRNAMSPRKFRLNAYQICIKILKARHLPQNANPMVVVKVGNRRKKTVVRERTDSPIYNDVKLDDIFFFFHETFIGAIYWILELCYSTSCSISFVT